MAVHNGNGDYPIRRYNIYKNICTNIGVPIYIMQILTEQREKLTVNNTIIYEDSNTQLTSIDRSYRPKINKETSNLNDSLDQMDFKKCRNSIPKQIIHSS